MHTSFLSAHQLRSDFRAVDLSAVERCGCDLCSLPIRVGEAGLGVREVQGVQWTERRADGADRSFGRGRGKSGDQDLEEGRGTGSHVYGH